jgi:hypothetical protein
MAFVAGGCSFSYQLENSLAKKEDAEQVSSLRPGPSKTPEPPPEADLAIARAALNDVLAKGGKYASMPWENPRTGARGTVTPLASSSNGEDGATCRDFLASYVKDGSESWLRGEACRAARGKWEVRNLRPWKNT